jgi:hypothetical protein
MTVFSTGPGLRLILPALLVAAPAASAHAQSADPSAGAAAGDSAPSLRIVRDCRGARDELVVCGRREERSSYRLPALHEGFDPDGPVDSVSRERHRLFELGEAGTGSCSTVGGGGWTGCESLAWKHMHQQHDGNTRIGFGVKPARGDF